MAAAMVEIPGYKIESELGRGGMASVHLAVQLSVERRVALKIMSPVLLVDPSFAERFIREAKIAASLYHPHVVAVHDVGVHEERPFIAMEYMPGGDLAARCSTGPVEVPFAVRVAREIAAALHYAHEKGFVHRDVKPENILFREDETAVLTDFGIARAVNSATQMTRTGAVIGTPQYMSPEQARGKELDGRSDLYGLGIVFFEMLTGKTPYQGSDSVAVGIKHVTEPLPKLPSRLAYIQPILDRFLAKHPADRYQTGGEALIDLKQLEAQVITGQTPRVEAPTPRPERAGGTRISDVPLIPAPPKQQRATDSGPDHPRVGVSATPRPDGTLRQEPTLGSLDDIHSFDRTVSQPQFREPNRSPARGRKSGARRWAILVVLAAIAAAGWWQRDALLQMLPDRDVQRLLDRARAAVEYEHWYGDTQQYANRLYQRVLELDPDNRRAVAGLELIAQHFADEAERAYADGNRRQALLMLERVEELAPELPRLQTLQRKFAVDASPREEPPEDSRVAALLDEAGRLSQQGRLVGPDQDSALARYRAVLALQPDHEAANKGIENIRETLIRRFDTLVGSGSVSAARDALNALALIVTDDEIAALREQLTQAEAARRTSDERRAGEQAAADHRSRVDALLSEARDHLAADRLTRPEEGNALAAFREVLKMEPDHQAARQGITEIARRYLQSAEVALEADRLDEAEEQIERVASLRPDLPGLERARNRLALYRQQRAGPSLSPEQTRQLEERIAAGREAMDRGDLMAPPGASAYDNFKAAQSLDPDNETVRQGMAELSTKLVAEARADLRSGQLLGARARYNDAQQADPFNPMLGSLRTELAAALRSGVSEAIAESRIDDAGRLFEQAALLEPDHEDLSRLQLQLSIARDAGG